MKILNRYIAMHVISATLFVSLVFLGVQSFIDFVEQLSDIGKSNYGLMQSFKFVLMTLPGDFYQLFPVIGLLGCLLGLGYLASSNQLIVMQSSGTSILKITWAVLRAALFMLVIVTFIGEWLAPHLRNRAANDKAISLQHAVSFSSFNGVWLHHQHDFIHIQKLSTPTQIGRLTLYSFDDHHRLGALYYAEKGGLKDKGWVLENVQKTSFLKNRVKTQRLKRLLLHIDIQPTILSWMHQHPSTLMLTYVYQYLRYFNRYNLNVFLVSFNFWQRLIQPLTTLVMIALSVPFIFGSLRDVSTGSRIVVGIIVGLGFYILNQFFGPFSLLFQWPAYLAAMAPTFCFLMICLWLLWRVKC
jgi:lipopolysaccharide export system permease protein